MKIPIDEEAEGGSDPVSTGKDNSGEPDNLDDNDGASLEWQIVMAVITIRLPTKSMTSYRKHHPRSLHHGRHKK